MTPALPVAAAAPVTPALLALPVAAAALAWLAYFRWKDAHRPEPVLLMLAVAGGGVASAALAHGAFTLLEGAGWGVAWEDLAGGPWARVAGAAARVGLVEEAAKLCAVLPVALLHRHFDEPLDGVVYAACAGVGFAAAESALLLAGGHVGPLDSLARAVAAPLSHALFAVPVGRGLAAAVLERRAWGLPVGLLVGAGAHGAYDVLLAQPAAPRGAAALVVLVLWVWLLGRVPALARLGLSRRWR